LKEPFVMDNRFFVLSLLLIGMINILGSFFLGLMGLISIISLMYLRRG